MPEHLDNIAATTTISTPKITPKTTLSAQRRKDIFRHIQLSAERCRLNYSGRKELATENDDTVTELCEALEDAFNYGLMQRTANTVAETAANLFQNMQEIVIGNIGIATASTANDFTFWDFCKTHLTPHERERYEKLKNVRNKCGWGKAFIRATLNEHSLQRYLLTWICDETALRRYYSPWSLLLDADAAQQLPHIVGSLNQILFALTIDTADLNTATRRRAIVREEPIINAPSPVPVSTLTKHKRRSTAIERPIATSNSTEDLLNAFAELSVVVAPPTVPVNAYAVEEEFMRVRSLVQQEMHNTPADNSMPQVLEFLKQPLPDYYPESLPANGTAITSDASAVAVSAVDLPEEFEDKSDSSSQYSKSSSANCSSSANAAETAALQEKLREVSERCAVLETHVAQLSLENRQLVRRLKQHFNGTGIDPSSSLSYNFLITIPHVKLYKSARRGSSSYYAYEIHITMRQHLEHWSLWRRYRDFYKLHNLLCRSHPSIASIEFPPKKHFGNMNLVFVEERRQQLQIYLLTLMESLPQVEACKSKAELQKVFPFLRDR